MRTTMCDDCGNALATIRLRMVPMVVEIDEDGVPDESTEKQAKPVQISLLCKWCCKKRLPA